MAHIWRKALEKAVEILGGTAGLGAEIAKIVQEDGIELGPLEPEQLRLQNVASELAEKTAGVKYPGLYVYCDGMSNLLREKFRGFSGKIAMTIEVRVTHDRLEKVSEQLLACVEAATNVLERNRGEWSPGLYYAGGYKVELGCVKPGGRNFLQVGKIRFELDASCD